MSGFPAPFLEVLRRADEVVAFTGAGMSAESGVPTFRGDGGLWQKFRPEELANVGAFLRNPVLVWEWYEHRRTVLAGVSPHPGHRALAAMEAVFPRVTVVTQNVDNLHRRAGSTRVLELHGNIERNYCIRCGARYDGADVPVRDRVPSCTAGAAGAACGGLIRPDVVWFGEPLPEEEWEAGVRAIGRADLCLLVGTSGVVYPAASLPALAQRQGAYTVEINPEPTPFTDSADLVLRQPAGIALPAILDAARAARSLHPPSPSPTPHTP
jgi:NAD-dependent deacetylase